ncbi:unnamed protein product [Closterium sp. NIES-54]
MASRALVSRLPRSLPPLPPGPAPTCVPCVEGRQRAAPHSSSFPPTQAPLQTLQMDVWGPARVRGQGHERYFLLVVDDYSRYTTVFPLRSKGEVPEVLIDWIRGARRQLSESFLAGDHTYSSVDREGWRCVRVPCLGISSFCPRYYCGQAVLPCHYAASLVAESASASVCPPSVGGECALGTDVLEDRQEDLECFAAASPHLVSMLLAPEGDPDALDIPTPRSYAEAIEGPYSSQWQAAMDTEMASWKSTGPYVDEVPPPGASIWHDMLRTTLAALGFAPSTADPSLFLRTHATLLPFYVLVYVDDLVFATADTEALAHVKSKLQKRHTCTDLGELTSYLGLRITRDKAQCTITLTQSHMVQQVLQRFGFTYSSPQSTPLPTGHSLSAPPSDESVEPSGLYPELVGCLMYLMTCTRPDLAYPLSLLARYVAPGRHRKVHWDAAKRVLRYLCSTSGMGLVLGGWARVVPTGHADASWELRWLTYLLTDLGEAPRSPPVLYVDNKAMLALCQEHRLEHKTKHIALRYFLARELQQRGQLRLAYVASQANTADVFTKALQPFLAFDHEGRPVAFDMWLDDLQLYLLSDTKDSVSLFDHMSGAATAPPATADSATRSQWLSQDAAARLAIRNHLPVAECAHFGQHRTAQALYDAVVARYSSPATSALGRLLLPYLFPDLSAFATVEDLVSHLRTSDARYRAALLAEFLAGNPPPMYIPLYFVVTHLPDSLRSVRDHFLSLNPTSLTVDLLEQHLLAAETSAVVVGAARGTPRPPFFEGTSGLLLLVQSAAAARARVARVVGVAAVVVEVAAGVVVGAALEVVAAVGLVEGVGVLVAAVGAAVGVAAVVAVGLVAVGLALEVLVLEVANVSSSSVGARPSRSNNFTCGKLHTQHCCFSLLDDAWRAEFGDDVELPRWADLLRSRIAIFDLDFDAIHSAMYALSVSAEGDYYRSVPPDPSIATASLGATESGNLLGIAPAQALHTFTLDSGALRCFFRERTTLTPLPAPVWSDWLTPPGARLWPVPPLSSCVRRATRGRRQRPSNRWDVR